jgi:L-iditol 2-dehydrogenase
VKRVVLVAEREFVIEDVAIPEPAADEAIIQVERCGICGSDVHAYNGLTRIRPPFVLGHEFSGTVFSLGSAVERLRIGERVTAEPGVQCGHCPACQAGRYNLCRDYYVIGIHPEHDGAYAQYIRVPGAKVLRLPNGMSFAEGAMVEPTACAMHALSVGDVHPGDRVLVVGGGTMGLLIAQAAGTICTRKVTVTDVVPERLALARQLGLGTAPRVAGTDLVTWATEEYGQDGIDRVFDAVGVPATFDLAFRLTRRGGRLITLAISEETMEWQPGLLRHEVMITGMKMYTRRNFEQAIEAIHGGRIQVEPLISRSYPLACVDDAFDAMLHDVRRVKLMLAPWIGES